MKEEIIQRRPPWLNKKIALGKCREVEGLLSGLGLNTVCHKALCPNIGECFEKKHATFLILGNLCTRGCAFCGVEKKIPLAPDPDEPRRVAEAARKLGLKHVVITSVTRDDLPDGGASVFAETVRALRDGSSDARIELLIPDLKGDRAALKIITGSRPDIIGHNLETVPSLYNKVRAPHIPASHIPASYIPGPDGTPYGPGMCGASYERSLGVIRAIKELDPSIYSKSGIMLGLGERQDEVLGVLRDLRGAACDFLSIGQYLRPSKEHYPVKEYLAPEKFEYYRITALQSGFKHCESAPYVRSSYMAAEYLA